MIRIFHHSTASDLIDIDVASGHWLPVQEDPDKPFHVGCASIVQRENAMVRGSYTVENGRRYCLLWTEEHELVFMTPDSQCVRLFKREANGALTDLAPRLDVLLQPATYGDGRAMPGMSTFSLHVPESGITHEVTYDSAAYIRLFGMASMLTFIPDEDLGDWDFFVGAKHGLDELRSIALRHTRHGACSNGM
jgi:hypothetical protein